MLVTESSYPGGIFSPEAASRAMCMPMHPHSQSALANFPSGRLTVRAPTNQSTHPPMFSLAYTHILEQTFACRFAPLPNLHPNTLSPLSFYIENVVRATGLPFPVTVASLIILQRLYTRLPPKAHYHREEYSPHLLFAGAYILAAKQHIYAEHILQDAPRHPHAPGLPATAKLSSIYWAEITGYSPAEVESIERDIIYIIGRNVVVFPIPDPDTQSYLKNLKSCPMRRNLPLRKDSTLRNLSRMTSEDHYDYFINAGRKQNGPPHLNALQPRPTATWWKRVHSSP